MSGNEQKAGTQDVRPVSRSLEQPRAIELVSGSEPECFCSCPKIRLLPQCLSLALYDKQETAAVCSSG